MDRFLYVWENTNLFSAEIFSISINTDGFFSAGTTFFILPIYYGKNRSENNFFPIRHISFSFLLRRFSVQTDELLFFFDKQAHHSRKSLDNKANPHVLSLQNNYWKRIPGKKFFLHRLHTLFLLFQVKNTKYQDHGHL